MPSQQPITAFQTSTSEGAGDVRIGLRAIQKSGRVLWAFSEFYLPFYGLPLEYLFRRWELFAGTSAVIYDIDEAAEASLATPSQPDLSVLSTFLAEHITIDLHITRLLDDARSYYDSERAMTQPDAAYSFEDLIQATSLRSFDFRLMHRSLAQLENHGYDEALFTWFEEFEAIMEFEDDLQTVEQDAQRGTFNAATLARRIERDAASMLEAWRREKEIRLRTIAEDLSSSQYNLTEQVLARYRELVPWQPVANAIASRRSVP